MIFVRDIARKQRAQGDSMGEAALDLVSYVEFGNRFNQICTAHRAALRSQRDFWQLLMRAKTSFKSLARAFESMDAAESTADRTYREALEKYPRSVKLLRSYAGYLEQARARGVLPACIHARVGGWRRLR